MAAKNATHYQLDLKAAIEFLANEDLDSFLLKFRLSAFCLVSQVAFNHEPPVDIISKTTEKLLHHYLGRTVPPNTETLTLFGKDLLKYGPSRKVARLGDDLCDLCTRLFFFMQYARMHWMGFMSLVPTLEMLSSLGPVISSLLCDLVRFSALNPNFDFGRSLEALVGSLLPATQRSGLTSKIDFTLPPDHPWSFQWYRSATAILADAAGVDAYRASEWLEIGRGTESQKKLLSTISNVNDMYNVARVRTHISFSIYVDDHTPSHLLTSGEKDYIHKRCSFMQHTAPPPPVPKGLADLLHSIGPDAVSQHMKEIMRELSATAPKTELKGCTIDKSLRFPDPVFQTQKPSAMASKSPTHYQLDLKAAVEFLMKEKLETFIPKFKMAAFCLVSKRLFDREAPADIISETTQKLLNRFMADPPQAAVANKGIGTLFCPCNPSPMVGRVCNLLGSLSSMLSMFKNCVCLQWTQFNSLVPALWFICAFGEEFIGPILSSLLNDLVSFCAMNPDFDFGLHLDAMAGPLLPLDQRRQMTSEIDLRSPPQYPWSYQYHGSVAWLMVQTRFTQTLNPNWLELGRATRAQRLALSAITNMDDVLSVAMFRTTFSSDIYVDGVSPEMTSAEKSFFQGRAEMYKGIVASDPMPPELSACLRATAANAQQVEEFVRILRGARSKVELPVDGQDPLPSLPEVIFKSKVAKKSNRGQSGTAQGPSTSTNAADYSLAERSPANEAEPVANKKREKGKKHHAPMAAVADTYLLELQCGRVRTALEAGDESSALHELTNISQQDLSAVDPQVATAVHVLRARLLLASENPSLNDITSAERSIAAATAFAGKKGFSAAILLQARVDLYRYKFNSVIEQLLALQDSLGGDGEPRCLLFPFSTDPIPWTTRDGLLHETRALLVQATYPPPPDHRCRSPICKDRSIYLTPHNGKDFVILTCSRKCTIAMHYDCFRKVKVACGLKELDDIKDGTVPCPTPSCYGVVTKIRLYHKDGGLFKTVKCQVPLTKHSEIICQSPFDSMEPEAPRSLLSRPVPTQTAPTSFTEPAAAPPPPPVHPTGPSPSLPEGQREAPPSTSRDAASGSGRDPGSEPKDSSESDAPGCDAPPERRFVVTLKR